MTDSVAAKLKKFSNLVKKTLSSKSKIILFGSYAKGKNKEWSDIDIAVIVPKVKNRLKSEIDLRVKSLQIDERINPFIFSYDEFNKNSPLIWEIKKYGKKVVG